MKFETRPSDFKIEHVDRDRSQLLVTVDDCGTCISTAKVGGKLGAIVFLDADESRRLYALLGRALRIEP